MKNCRKSGALGNTLHFLSPLQVPLENVSWSFDSRCSDLLKSVSQRQKGPLHSLKIAYFLQKIIAVLRLVYFAYSAKYFFIVDLKVHDFFLRR